MFHYTFSNYAPLTAERGYLKVVPGKTALFPGERQMVWLTASEVFPATVNMG